MSALGLGCFGLSHAYGRADDSESIKTVRHALDLGCNLLDTADEYGAGHNESLLGRALDGCRNQAFLSTKFGIQWDANGDVTGLNGRPEYVHEACHASLRRLNTSVIDLYYLHRVDPQVPIEDTVGAMAQLVRQGKVRYLGLSEASPDILKRAYAVHPIAALQSEYSLWTRDPEAYVLPVCRELGIGLVAFSPLGRGFFSGQLSQTDIGPKDFRKDLPRFKPEHFTSNLKVLSGLKDLARKKQCTSAQLALAWLLAQGEDILAIPGSKSVAHLEENFAAVSVGLSHTDLNVIEELLAGSGFSGARYAGDSPFRPDQ